ncbi:hypothetical protein QC764_0095880 [Podospora pseudoanserina]|uniref:Uncharacterized protein n=1 Tax=Podospora pseudoanserina TaxID=2609844 RepID=A0ABR0HTR6_9PEZI|nr:hypothetical protein QC764_0095880 [Podospora pseudoanserina]
MGWIFGDLLFKMEEPNGHSKHARHYPVDIPHATPFNRYHHIELTDFDLLIADLLQDFMNPQQLPPFMAGPSPHR